MAIFKFYQIFRSLKSELGEKAHEIFPEYKHLPDKMSPQDQAALGKTIMDRMNEKLKKEDILKIRHKHTCNISKEQKAKIDELKALYDDLDLRCQAYSKFMAPGYVKKTGSHIQVSFGLNKCVCSMYRKLDDYQLTTNTWCECCNGHVIKMYSYLFDQSVGSKILETIVSGGKDCLFDLSIIKGDQ